MTETDDKLIRTFLAEQKQEIPDNGFSRRVMHRLPNRTSLLAKISNLFVALVAIILFLAFDGLQAIVATLRNLFVGLIQHGAMSGIDFRSLAIVAVVLVFLGVRKAWSMT